VRHITRLCDRCGGVVLDQGCVLAIEAGSLCQRFPRPLDLCDSCTGLFTDFLQSGHQASHVSPGPGIPAPLCGITR
jgi:hypothetical protein